MEPRRAARTTPSFPVAPAALKHRRRTEDELAAFEQERTLAYIHDEQHLEELSGRAAQARDKTITAHALVEKPAARNE